MKMKKKVNKIKINEEVKILKSENRELKKVLGIIFSAKTFKIWQFYCHVRYNLLKNNHFRNCISYFYKKIKKIIKDKINPFIVYIPAPKLVQKFNNVSIVIPTYNGAHYFPTLIKAIKMQKNIVNPEIIFVDSESTDETLRLAEYYNVKVVKIKKKEFNHGLARNIGAKNAKGEYIIFTVQDALPIDNFTYANMISTLVNNQDVVGVSTKQTPYPDADIFAKWQTYTHNSTLELNSANFISSLPKNKNFYKLPFFEKRKISIYDDVCSCVKKSDFIKLGEYKKINFAEDIDFSIRALLNGYKIAFTGTSGVIHSHNRPTEYFLKRYYADNRVVSKLFKEKHKSFFQSIDDIFQYCYTTFLNIYRYLDSREFQLFMPDFDIFIENINKIKKRDTSEIDSQILNILVRLSVKLNIKIDKNKNYNMIDETIYEQFKNIFNESVKLIPMKQYDSPIIKKFSDKLFTTIVGSHLNMFTLKDKDIEKKLDIILMKGI